MIIVSAKITAVKMVIGVILSALLLCLIIVVVGSISSASREASGASGITKNIKTNKDRIAFLSSYGWEVSEEPVETQEILIPEVFNDVYTKYNEIQLKQGFDLTKYPGKRIKRYAYQITNYKTGESSVIADLLIYKDNVIGGDIHSLQLDGFMCGFDGE